MSYCSFHPDTILTTAGLCWRCEKEKSENTSNPKVEGMVQMPSGAVRSAHYAGGVGRPEANRLDLLFKNREALETYAEAYARGMRKYGRENWKKGLPESGLIQHALDHLIHYVNGTYDPGEQDVDQLSGVLWNIGTLCWTRKHKPELLDVTGPDPGPDKIKCAACDRGDYSIGHADDCPVGRMKLVKTISPVECSLKIEVSKEKEKQCPGLLNFLLTQSDLYQKANTNFPNS